MGVLQLPSPSKNRQQRREALRGHQPVASRGAATEAVSLPAPPLTVDQAVVLDVIAQPPVMFHRALVDVTGDVKAALWLSYTLCVAREPSNEDRWFVLSQDACFEAIGLSRREQESARARVRECGILEERRQGRTMAYRLNTEQLANLLSERSAATWSLPPSVLSNGTHA